MLKPKEIRKVEEDIEEELKYVATYANSENRERLLNFLKGKFKEWSDIKLSTYKDRVREEIIKMNSTYAGGNSGESVEVDELLSLPSLNDTNNE